MSSQAKEFFSVPNRYLHRRFGINLRSQIVASMIPDVQGKSFLDVGCGDGTVGLQFLSKNRVAFCDASESMMGLVKSAIPDSLTSNANLILGTLEDLDESRRYDYVICLGVLAHVESISLAVRKLRNLLAEDGKLILQFSDSGNWLTRLSIRTSRHGYRINGITQGEMYEMINQEGLVRLARVQYYIMLPLMGRLPDKWLQWIQQKTLENRFLSLFGSEQVWMLGKKN